MNRGNHIAVLSDLPDETRRALVHQSDGPGLVCIGVHWSAILLTGYLIQDGAPLYPMLMLIQGVLIVFVFGALHETVHLTAFRSDILNRLVGHITGFASFLPARHFRYFHLAHHKFTQDPERDPELASPKAATPWQYLKYMSGLPEWAFRICALFRNAVVPNTDPYVPERGRARVMHEARLYLAGYGVLLAVSVVAQSALLIWVWLIPVVLGQPFMRGFLLAEHAGCPPTGDMLENTRTTYTNPVVRFLAWNMPYHIEHHAYPAVPFYNLPTFHQILKDHLVHTENGYLRFNAGYFHATKNGQTAAPQEA